jgi:hypothetical protein
MPPEFDVAVIIPESRNPRRKIPDGYVANAEVQFGSNSGGKLMRAYQEAHRDAEP